MGTLERIDIIRESLGHALKDKLLAVPMNQRSYAWQQKHVGELLADLSDAISSGHGEYFLGSIVVTEEGSGRPLVVDGQQRLATTMILLAAIRDYLADIKEAERADQITKEFLVTTDLHTLDKAPRFELGVTDNDYFVKRVLKFTEAPREWPAPVKESHRRIHKAALLAREFIDDLASAQQSAGKVKAVLRWVRFLEDGARVIWVTVPDSASAYVIFETMNDRGLELSASDLLKNYLFGRSGNRQQEAQERWFAMTGALESVSQDDIVVTYIRHFWSSMYGPTRARELFDKIKLAVRSKQQAIDFSTALALNANSYSALLNPEHELWNKFPVSARKHIITLNRLRMEQVRPLLLAVIETFSVSDVVKCLRLFVCWSVRFLIVGGLGGGSMERHYAERAIEVRKMTIRTAAQLAKAMSAVVPGDAEFESEFRTARVSQAFIARYYLRAMELEAAGSTEPEMIPNDDEVVNLEHILPVSPGPGWNHIKPDIAQAYYKRIGNMVLLQATANTGLGNLAFAEKRIIFAKSKFKLTKKVASATAWNALAIDKRQLALAKLAVKTWPLK